MPEFDFNFDRTAGGTLHIEDPANVAIEAWNNDGLYYYLIIRTLLGTSSIAKIGPVVPDVALLPSGFTQSLNHIECNVKKLNSEVTYFLNDRSAKITNAKVIDIDDAISQVRDFQRYLQDYNEELY